MIPVRRGSRTPGVSLRSVSRQKQNGPTHPRQEMPDRSFRPPTKGDVVRHPTHTPARMPAPRRKAVA